MRLVPLFALVSLVTTAAAAQTAPATNAPAQTTQGVVALQANAQGCPVGFEARHARDGGLVSVSPSAKHPEQGYTLTFAPSESHAIAQARITLHGIAGPHVLPAGERPGAETTETFNISPSSGAKHLFHSTVFAEKLTGVQWVELNELTYADGTAWHESASAVCRVAPNGYMLVAARR